jgi:hypothetical protein
MVGISERGRSGEVVTTAKPECRDGCAQELCKMMAAYGVEITVSTAPPLVAGPYTTDPMTCALLDISIGKDALGWWATCDNCGQITSHQPDRPAAREKAAEHIGQNKEN